MQKRILLCDDELHILKAAEFKFARSGYSVQCAGDGEQAWAFIEQQAPDIVVTDCQMPRVNGLELAKRIKGHAATRHLPVVMLSAKGFELSADELREEYGIARLLCKPFSPRELFGVVEGLLQGQEVVAGPVISGLPTSIPVAVSQWL